VLSLLRQPICWPILLYHNHWLRAGANTELEHIRPRVVTGHVEHPLRPTHAAGIDLGIQDALLLAQRTGDELAVTAQTQSG
jgi:hypothetical protein